MTARQLALTTPAAPVPAATPAAGRGPAPLVIGLDIALVNTGVAGPGWTDHIRTAPLKGEPRLDAILDRAASFYQRADLVVIEGPAYNSAKQKGHDEMAAARWFVRVDLWRRRIPYAIVPPDNRTLYALGTTRPKHPATYRRLDSDEAKGAVRDAVRERYGIECEGTTRYDQADAYILTAMGLHWLGYPLANVPPTHARALDGVAWPAAPAVAR